ncbi:RAD50-interacting protein 1 [Chrysoperla carnea]|uniref:RAD50-interacting protein 1 n=1 Tax=Chrysoperla carnea TaxID=189513 RepID=UPI001D0906FE|nr:RAD50-interacting protein 1 [Chrysoperla carnea]XP_044732585.1 RAD50-interacting protein 1 [Chrysoperla carnea]
MNIPTQNPIRLKVIERLNKELGKDIKNLNKIDVIKTQLINEKETALKKIDLENVEAHTIIKDAINKLNKDIESIDKINREFETYSTNAIQYLGTTNDIVKHLQDYVNKIKSLEIIIEYFNISKKIQNISNELYQSIIEHDDELSVTLYANLCEIQLNLRACPATHLLIYLKDVIHHWHNYLKDKFSVVFDEILKQIKWPFVNTNLTSPILNSNNESIIKLQTYCEYLLQIQLPPPNEQLQEVPSTYTICLPIQLLIRPLKKRFQYHFYGNKQTNRSDKPEWYMTQILTWIRDHQQFIQNIIQPVINRLAMHHINARIEFMKGLIQICIDKLDNELPTLAYDDALFSHCVDETLGMDRELRTVYNLPISQSGCLTPLTNPVILQKWLNMEKKYALEKMDSIFTSSTALQNIILNDDDDNDNVDNIKITECGNTFITLLKTMSERYQSLPQPGHRLQFLDLQLDLLDDFRIRLLQLSHPDNTLTSSSTTPGITGGPLSLSFTSRISYILNTISYIIDTLIEWSETIHFINLHYFKSQFIKQHGHTDSELSRNEDEPKETDSVFDETISLYTHMKNDLISMLTETVVLDVKARSRSYRHDTWNTMQYINDDRSLSLTTSGCPMYQILATRLHELNELLTIQIFTSVWKLIAKQINLFLYDELILENFFNDGGAKQLHYDIMKNLLPLFAQFTNKPQIYFKTVIEACTLLVLSKSTAILLMDTLDNESIQTQKDALQELGVRKLNTEDAINILKLRSDLREVIYRHY